MKQSEAGRGNQAKKRVRATQACVPCRKKKIKCDGTKPECLHCAEANIRCEYSECRKRGPRKGYVQLLEERLAQLERRLTAENGVDKKDCDKRDSLYVDLPKDIVMHLVDLFFEHLNSVFPIVHRATLKQAIEDGTVSKPLLWSVLAIGARFSDHPMIKTDPPYWAGEGFANRATALIDASLLEPSIPNLQFWGIMACVEYGRASGSRAWIYGGIAARICQDLGLNKEETLRLPIHRKDDSVDTVAMALRRRIFWSCICIDKFTSAGTSRPQYFDVNDYDAMTPNITESMLLRDIFQCTTLDGREIQNDSLMDIARYYIRLTMIFGETNKYMSRAKSDSVSVSWPPIPEFSTLDKKLRMWRENLPESFQFNETNFEKHKKSGSRNYITMWLSAHAVWCTTMMVLHRGSLAYSDLSATELPLDVYHRIQASIETCKMSVKEALVIFQSMKDICGCDVLPYMGYSAYIFATVLMTSTFSKDPESARKSNRGLTVLYEMIESLKPYWPLCERLATTTKDLLSAHTKLYAEQLQPPQSYYTSAPPPPPPLAAPEPRLQPSQSIATTSNTSSSASSSPSDRYFVPTSSNTPYAYQPSIVVPNTPSTFLSHTSQQPTLAYLAETLPVSNGSGEIDFNSSQFLYDSALFGQIMFDGYRQMQLQPDVAPPAASTSSPTGGSRADTSSFYSALKPLWDQ